MSKCCLFGGALVAAGVAANTEAAVFQYQDDPDIVEQASAYAIVGSDFQQEFALLPDDLNMSVTASDAGREMTASNAFGSTEIRGEVSWNGVGDPSADLVGVIGQHTFTVDQDTSVLASWDVSGMDIGASSYFDVLLDDFTPVLSLYFGGNAGGVPPVTDPLSGSQVLNMVAGQTYFISYSIVGNPTTTDPQFASLFIPAPGAVGVLGLAGVMAMRRRRA